MTDEKNPDITDAEKDEFRDAFKLFDKNYSGRNLSNFFTIYDLNNIYKKSYKPDIDIHFVITYKL